MGEPRSGRPTLGPGEDRTAGRRGTPLIVLACSTQPAGLQLSQRPLSWDAFTSSISRSGWAAALGGSFAGTICRGCGLRRARHRDDEWANPQAHRGVRRAVRSWDSHPALFGRVAQIVDLQPSGRECEQAPPNDEGACDVGRVVPILVGRTSRLGDSLRLIDAEAHRANEGLFRIRIALHRQDGEFGRRPPQEGTMVVLDRGRTV